MELKTFIAETIKEIIDGIAQAQDDIITKYPYSERGYVEIGNDNQNAIKFDISVTSSESNEAKGDAGIRIKVVNFGVNGKVNTQNSAENKISFTIPVVFPTVANKKFS